MLGQDFSGWPESAYRLRLSGIPRPGWAARSCLRALISPLLLLLLLSGCQFQPPVSPPLMGGTLPVFADDGDRQSLLACARLHRQYLAGLPPGYRTTVAGVSYPADWLLQSMDEFIALLEQNPDPQQLTARLRENFIMIPAGGRSGAVDGEMLVTGYYEPLFAGSLERKGPYLYPLYSVPASLIRKKGGTTDKKNVGRQSGSGDFVPFWTRAEIENNHHLAGNELVYLKDPFEVFLLHVQGSGRIQLQNGSQRSVRFAGHNGHPYKSIGKLLVDEGKLTLKEASIPAIRHYIDTHPADQQRILQHNPRYIFFSWGDDLPPRGSLGKPLTAGRSIAIDRKALPDGLFGWLETSRPVVDKSGAILKWQPMHRFVLPQDSGAAIEGTGRVDFFWGSGQYAEIAASSMKEKGKLYFFIKKGFEGN